MEASVVQPSASHVLLLTCSCCCTPSFVQSWWDTATISVQLQCAHHPDLLVLSAKPSIPAVEVVVRILVASLPLAPEPLPGCQMYTPRRRLKQHTRRPLDTMCSQTSQEPATYRPPWLQAQTRPAARGKRKALRWPELVASRQPARALGRA